MWTGPLTGFALGLALLPWAPLPRRELPREALVTRCECSCAAPPAPEAAAPPAPAPEPPPAPPTAPTGALGLPGFLGAELGPYVAGFFFLLGLVAREALSWPGSWLQPRPPERRRLHSGYRASLADRLSDGGR